MFEEIDADHSGSISYNELSKALDFTPDAVPPPAATRDCFTGANAGLSADMLIDCVLPQFESILPKASEAEVSKLQEQATKPQTPSHHIYIALFQGESFVVQSELLFMIDAYLCVAVRNALNRP